MIASTKCTYFNDARKCLLLICQAKLCSGTSQNWLRCFCFYVERLNNIVISDQRNPDIFNGVRKYRKAVNSEKITFKVSFLTFTSQDIDVSKNAIEILRSLVR